MKLSYKFRAILIVIILAFGFSCTDPRNKNTLDDRDPIEVLAYKLDSVRKSNPIKNAIADQLKSCLPEGWVIWEEYEEEYKTPLNHIGKGEFDLHFRATYQCTDTLYGKNTNGKKGNLYYPEVILHFYKNMESIKESVKFTRDHWQMVSDMHPMYDFAETREYLIYGGYNEVQEFQPEDLKLKELKQCLMAKSKLLK